MKLKDLAPRATLKRTAKVYESYFDEKIEFLEKASPAMARSMLNKVQALIQEQRNSPEFHSSEQNPNYLKLVFIEQALEARIREAVATAMGGTSIGSTPSASATAASTDPVKAQAAQQAAVNRIRDPRLKAAMQKSMKGQALSKDEQGMVANAALASGGLAEDGYEPGEATPDMKTAWVNSDITTNESRYNRLTESEVQQAQVVLASQDMVDQVQKMIEEVTAMQYKDLPALVDQIRNQIGVEPAGQFNGDANSALSELVQNLEAAKQKLTAATGVVTGQEAVIPGDEDLGMGGELPDEQVGELPPLEEPEEEPAMPGAGAPELGRGRR